MYLVFKDYGIAMAWFYFLYLDSKVILVDCVIAMTWLDLLHLEF